MNLGMYKAGQGYWTRVLTALGVGALMASCAHWVNTHFLAVEAQSQKAVVWAAVLGVTAIALWIVLNTPRVVDFMISVETEMKKVSWPTRKVLLSMTGIVVGGLLGLAALVWGIDTIFTLVFQTIHILPK